MATLMLVHGAYHGASCWRRVVPALEARGHRVLTPELAAPGDTAADELTFVGWTDDLVRTIEAEGAGRVILVGHSRGGLVVSAVAEARPDLVERLVYVAAYLPRDGESLLDLAQQDTQTELVPHLAPSQDGSVFTVTAEGARSCFYQLSDDGAVADAVESLRPEPAFGLTTPVRLTAERFGSVPRHYVASLRDKAIGPELQRRMYGASPCLSVDELDCDHSPFFSAADGLVQALDRIASHPTGSRPAVARDHVTCSA